MNFPIDQITDLFYLFLLPFTRISSFFLVAPFFALEAINIRIRVAISFIVTLLAINLIDFNPVNLPLDELVNQIFIQIFIGTFSGFLFMIINGAITIAGQAISNSLGLGMANMVDPSIGSVPLLSQFLIILSTLIFITMDGHLIIISIILQSFSIIAVGTTIDLNIAYSYLIEWTPFLFLGGLVIALPILISVLLINIGLGMITRSAPSLNIISVGFPIIIIIGFIILILAIPNIIGRIIQFWDNSFEVVIQFMEDMNE